MVMTVTQSQSFRTGRFFSRPDAFKLYYKYNQMGQAKPSTFTNNSKKRAWWFVAVYQDWLIRGVDVYISSVYQAPIPPTDWDPNGCAHAACWGTEEAHIFPSVIKSLVLCLPETIEKVGINLSRPALLHLHITQFRLRPLDSFTGKVSQEPETG